MLNQTREKFIRFCLKNACYLVPYPEPDTRARLLKNSALFLYVLVLLSFQLYLYRLSPQILGFATNITAVDLYDLTNQEREEAGASSVSRNAQLEQAAYKKAQDMFTKNYWAHYAPDGSTTPWQFILESGYTYKFAGENLAKDFDTSYAVVSAWIASPSHRANLLNNSYKDVGIVTVNGVLLGEETTLVVQLFGAGEKTAGSDTGASEESRTISGPTVGKAELSQPAALTAVGVTPVEQIVRALNPSASPKTIPLGFGFFLLGLFALDEIAVLRGGIARGEWKRTAENAAHMVILALLMVVVWLTRVGGIL